MAKYAVKVKARAWKQHTCLTCGTAYRYQIQRIKQSSASDPALAQADAYKLAEKAIAEECDQQPCPHCGLFQPEMIGTQRRGKHGWLTFATAMEAGLVALLCGSYAFQYAPLCWVALGFGVITFVWHCWAIGNNPNSDMARNRAVAQNAVAKGAVQLVQQGTGPVLTTVPLSSSGLRLALVLLIAGLCLFPLAEIQRRLSGWSYNENYYPPVVGPGDSSRFYMRESVTSVKGYWSGHASVEVAHEKELGMQPADVFSLRTKTDGWSGTISNVKSSEERESSTIYVELGVPDQPALAGKAVDLKLTVQGVAPVMAGNMSYNETSFSFTDASTLVLSEPKSGARYATLWWSGTMYGFLLQFIAGLLLYRKARGLLKGLPTRLDPI